MLFSCRTVETPGAEISQAGKFQQRLLFSCLDSDRAKSVALYESTDPNNAYFVEITDETTEDSRSLIYSAVMADCRHDYDGDPDFLFAYDFNGNKSNMEIWLSDGSIVGRLGADRPGAGRWIDAVLSVNSQKISGLKLGCEKIDGPYTDMKYGTGMPSVNPEPQTPTAFTEKDLLNCKGSKLVKTVKVIESTDPNASMRIKIVNKQNQTYERILVDFTEQQKAEINYLDYYWAINGNQSALDFLQISGAIYQTSFETSPPVVKVFVEDDDFNVEEEILKECW